MKNTADVTGGKPIAVLLQSISGVRAINPLVAFYDIHGGKREVLFFYFVPNTTRDIENFYGLNSTQLQFDCIMAFPKSMLKELRQRKNNFGKKQVERKDLLFVYFSDQFNNMPSYSEVKRLRLRKKLPQILIQTLNVIA
jgi:hypothetical protein